MGTIHVMSYNNNALSHFYQNDFLGSSTMPFSDIIMESNLQHSYSGIKRQVCIFTVWVGEVLTSLHGSAECSTELTPKSHAEGSPKTVGRLKSPLPAILINVK